MKPINFHKYGVGTLLVEWNPIISIELLDVISNYERTIMKLFAETIIGMTPAYNSLLVHFNYKLTTHESLIDKILNMSIESDTSTRSTHWEIKVNYNDKYGIDLDFLSDTLNLEKSEIIKFHTSPIYTVHFIGFLPGFPYLSGLDNRIHCPRRTDPRIRITAGSVAIGGGQTGIYPCDSPGGWHVIGHTDFTLFNASDSPPCPVQPGDTIEFIAIN